MCVCVVCAFCFFVVPVLLSGLIAMALSVKADETALELFRRSNRSPLRTGIAFLDEVMRYMDLRILNSILLFA